MDGAAGPEVQAFLHKHELETQRQLPSWEETLKSDVRKESAAEIAALTSQVAKLQAENAALRSAKTAAQKVSEDLQVRGSQTSCAAVRTANADCSVCTGPAHRGFGHCCGERAHMRGAPAQTRACDGSQALSDA